jgi:hypothetical protein
MLASIRSFVILLSRNVKVKLYKTIFLPVVLYGTWSFTLREEHRLREFENRVLRRIFGPKRDDVMEEWRKLHNGKLHNLYHLQISLGRSNTLLQKHTHFYATFEAFDTQAPSSHECSAQTDQIAAKVI